MITHICPKLAIDFTRNVVNLTFFSSQKYDYFGIFLPA